MFEGIKNVGVLEDDSKDKERKVNISKELAKHTTLGAVAGKKFEKTVAKMKQDMSKNTVSVDMKSIMNQQNKKQKSVSNDTQDNSSQFRLTRQLLNKLGLKK